MGWGWLGVNTNTAQRSRNSQVSRESFYLFNCVSTQKGSKIKTVPQKQLEQKPTRSCGARGPGVLRGQSVCVEAGAARARGTPQTDRDTKLLYCWMLRLRMSEHGPRTRSNRGRSSLTHFSGPRATTVAARGRFISRAISPGGERGLRAGALPERFPGGTLRAERDPHRPHDIRNSEKTTQ